MALEPVLFPDLEGPDFVKSSEVERLAEQLLEEHGRAGGISRLFEVRRAIRNDELAIAYLLNTKPFDPLKDDVTHDAIAKCVKAPGLWHDVTGIHVAIWVRAYFWNQFDDRQRAAVVTHELLHVQVDRDDADQPKLRLRRHDVEEFTDVVRRYGLIDSARQALVKAAGLYEEDGGEPKAGESAIVDFKARRKGKTAPDDETDVRPAGDVNVDELKGEAERASEDDEG